MSQRTGPPHVLIEDLHVDPTAFVAPGAAVVGRVTLGARASVWFAATIRADMDRAELGEESNLQDGSVIHVDEGFPTIVRRRVTIGHRAVVHGATLEDECLVGMGAVVLNGAHVGRGALVGAGALVREGQEVPPGALAVGAPARVVGQVSAELAERMARGVDHYAALGEAYRAKGYGAPLPAGGAALLPAGGSPEPELDWAGAVLLLTAMPTRLSAGLAGLAAAGWRKRPAEDRWAVVEVLCHLRDVEREVFGARMTQLLAAPAGSLPVFPSTDGNVWARERRYLEDDPERALADFEAARAANLASLAHLGPADWKRTGVHPLRGAVSLLEQVRRWAGHDLSHLRQIARTRHAAGV